MYLTIITSWPSSIGSRLIEIFPSWTRWMSSNTSGVQRGLSPKIEPRILLGRARFISVKVRGYLLSIRFDVDANHCLRCSTTARP